MPGDGKSYYAMAVTDPTIPANPTHAAAQTSSFNTNGVDSSLFQRVMAVIDIGAVTGINPTFDAKWQSSPDNVSYSDVEGTSGLAATTITSSNKTVTMTIRNPYVGGNKYVRLAITLGGTNPSVTCSIVLYGEPASGNDAAQVVQRVIAGQ